MTEGERLGRLASKVIGLVLSIIVLGSIAVWLSVIVWAVLHRPHS